VIPPTSRQFPDAFYYCRFIPWTFGIPFLLVFFPSNLLADESWAEHHVLPILSAHCLECHSATDPSASLDLSSAEGFLRGGDSGMLIDRVHVADSLLLKRIESGEMPPEKNGKSQSLNPVQIELIQRWFADGAPWPPARKLDVYDRSSEKRAGRDWWSFQPLAKPSPPRLKSDLHPIDAWIEKQRSEAGFVAAPAASPRILLRRLYFDLTGLPPSAEALDAFEVDPSETRFESIVDELLASPRFAERWARYWLDLVRYAETNGYERDALKPLAWRYRDWVIQAIQEDMPFDRFITEQIAGDEIENPTEASTVATGFLRLGTWDDEPNDPLEYQYDRLEDLVHATSTAFLGLTVKCARCHDHKFDPIPQTDYYRIAGAFWAGPVAHRQTELNGGPSHDELGYDVLGWTDITREPAPLTLFKKGNIHRPGPVVAPGSLTATTGCVRTFDPPAAGAKTTQRRLQLAQWITDQHNPLTARVAVNRLWQHLFGEGFVRTPDNFGFQGQRPTHPELLDWLAVHLIDGGWKRKPLIKSIVMSKTYRMSSVHPEYAAYEQIDPTNRLFWRANRRRLDAEALRDTLLQTSGRLDLRMGGPSFMAPISAEALEGLSMKAEAYHASPPEETRRRSIYMFAKRSLAVPLMAVFDGCDTTTPVGKRDVTIVAPQALTLFNNQIIHEESQAIANLAISIANHDDDRISYIWRRILGRCPNEAERMLANEHLHVIHSQAYQTNPAHSGESSAFAPQAWASLCHVLINTNEFIFVD
jgi:Protein of unknown function (DUF1553)/Protein of unknown function (DUF1549)/Planctomycete cytochrome C